MVDRDIDVLTDGLTMQTVAVIFDKNSHFLSLGEKSTLQNQKQV